MTSQEYVGLISRVGLEFNNKAPYKWQFFLDKIWRQVRQGALFQSWLRQLLDKKQFVRLN
jgi:hypothetical protein